MIERNHMAVENLTQTILAAIEEELHQAIARKHRLEQNELYAMMSYHMGWEGEGAGLEARGKRVRPLLVCLSCAAAGGDWKKSLPAAAAVEMVHNFSLIHDDIEDDSSLRRGRPTVWKKWGIPQAINTGDAMFALAHLTILGLESSCALETASRASAILLETCLDLTQGQFMDIAYENHQELSIEAYWSMVSGKTAALLAACTEIGALAASCSAEVQQAFHEFGHALGLAFQAQDDYLGIWGDAETTGKSSESDLVTGKKSLPILFGLHQKGGFYDRWTQGPILPDEAPAMAKMLEDEGAKCYTKEAADLLTRDALQSLRSAHPKGEAGAALKELAQWLLGRRV
jgi:geranylgeranyl diphosphate synthase type I